MSPDKDPTPPDRDHDASPTPAGRKERPEGVHEFAGDAAAYALGALEPHETERFRAHLAECVVCRDEVAAFRETVKALPAAANQYEAPRTLRSKVVRAVRDEPHPDPSAPPSPRRRGRGFVARPAIATAAVVVIALIALALTQLPGSGNGGSRTIQAGVGSAELRLSGGHAELIVRHLPPPAAGRIYELWLERGANTPSPTNTLFSVTRQETASVGVPGSLNGLSAVLVTSEPAGGSPSPTRTPVIVARLS